MVALLTVIAAGAALLLLPGSDDGLLGLPPLAVGQDAPRSIKSPREFAIEDPETTERLRLEAIAQVLPIYDLVAAKGGEAKVKIEAAFAAAAELDTHEPGATAAENGELHRLRAQAFMRALQTILDEEALLPLIKPPVSDELRDAAIVLVQTIYESRIVEDRALLKLQAPSGLLLRIVDTSGGPPREERLGEYRALTSVDQARARVDELVAEQLKRLPVEQRRAVAVLVKRMILPNIVANAGETERRKEEAASAVKMVVNTLEQGEIVLRAGERVTERHLFLLRGMEKELRAQSRVQASLGSALLIVLLVVLTYGFMNRSIAGFGPSHRDLAFLASAYLLTLLLTWVGYKASVWLGEELPFVRPPTWRMAMPIASGALLIRFVLGPGLAAAFVPLVALTAGWMMGSSLGFAAYALCGSLAAISVRDTDRPRTALFVAGVRAALAQGFVVAGLALLESRAVLEDNAADLLAAAGSGLLASLLAAALVPAVEVLFGYTTDIKLTDLANLNHPLLRELLVEAPGTYHHSIMVSALAEAAAEAIGANRLLARVGGYYHDIGKIKSPRAFEENKPAPTFVTVAPAEEAAAIRAHVADGLMLAAKHRLGQQVLELIAQHHGTSVVRNTHRRALDLEAMGSQSALDRSLYAYSGPKPLSREAALVMLADVVEVATRDLAASATLGVEEIGAAVEKVVREVIDSGQLEECELTLRDLNGVVAEFTAVLEDRLIHRGRPQMSTLPRIPAAKVVRPPSLGELN